MRRRAPALTCIDVHQPPVATHAQPPRLDEDLDRLAKAQPSSLQRAPRRVRTGRVRRVAGWRNAE
eukprot:12032938-Alexandrium_andersonii.AAC.1